MGNSSAVGGGFDSVELTSCSVNRRQREKGWKGKEEGRKIMIHLGHWIEKFYLRTDISRE